MNNTNEDMLPCIVFKCYKRSVNKSRCHEHQLEAFRGNFRKERLPSDWSTRRRAILNRDKYICYLCGDGGADAVDHIKVGDDHSYDNLAAVHQNVEPFCHRSKTANEANAAIQEMKRVETITERWRKRYEAEAAGLPIDNYKEPF